MKDLFLTNLINDTINAIEAKGYSCSKREFVKNGVGVCKHGIVITKEDCDCCPVLYIEDFIASSGQYIADQMIEYLENENLLSEAVGFSTDLDNFTDLDFIYSNIRIGVQGKHDDELFKVRTSFDGIDKYFYIYLEDKKARAKITDAMIDMFYDLEGFSVSEMIYHATENTKNDIRITSIMELLFGIPDDNGFLFVVTNKAGSWGAAGMLFDDVIDEFAKSKGWEGVAILPSSIHEVIITEYREGDNIEKITNIVKEVNSEEVAPEERLADKAYYRTF